MMISYQDFNKFLDENEIDIQEAGEGECIFSKMLEVMAFQNKKIDNLENGNPAPEINLDNSPRLCPKHGGIGFVRDCHRCKEENK